MKQYVSYKDSEALWVGKVPANWKRTRIKYLLSRSSAGVWGDDEKGDANDVACFRVADFDYEHGYLSFEKLTYRNIEPKQLEGRVLSLGDLLIEKSGGGDATPVGRVVRFNYNDYATCSNFVHSVSTNDDCLSDYLYYYFFAMYANKENLLYFNQTTGIQNLKVGEYLSQTIFLPPFDEQKAIATYLEKKCGEIDKAIATQQKRIELLQELRQNIITYAVTRGINPDAQLKNSGVEWIGEVPEHWEKCRFKDFTILVNKPSTSEKKIGLENIEGKTGKFIETNSEFDGDGIAFERGDIVYGKLRPYLQKVWLATFEGNAVGDFFVFHSKQNCECKFLQYLMLSDGFTSECNGATLGAKMPRVSSDFIRSLHYFLPPLSEQQAIVAHIEAEITIFDKQVAKAESQISLLQELKQSVITEVVTGKRKVC